MSNGCEGTPHEVNFIEHVEVYIDMTYSVRGDLKIFLISPNSKSLKSVTTVQRAAYNYTITIYISIYNSRINLQ